MQQHVLKSWTGTQFNIGIVKIYSRTKQPFTESIIIDIQFVEYLLVHGAKLGRLQSRIWTFRKFSSTTVSDSHFVRITWSTSRDRYNHGYIVTITWPLSRDPHHGITIITITWSVSREPHQEITMVTITWLLSRDLHQEITMVTITWRHRKFSSVFVWVTVGVSISRRPGLRT